MAPDERLLARFFIPNKRERYIEMIGHPKKRSKFIPGKLAYYEGEALGDRWILERRD